MPSKYPVVRPEEVISFLLGKGFCFISQKGSHRKYSDGNHTVIVPMHNELAKGTLKSILSQSGSSLDEFLDFLS